MGTENKLGLPWVVVTSPLVNPDIVTTDKKSAAQKKTHAEEESRYKEFIVPLYVNVSRFGLAVRRY